MLRNLKMLWLTSVVALAASASLAASAQAVGDFTASSYPWSATGSNSKGAEELKTEAGGVQCSSHFVSGAVGAPTSTLVLTPKYTECSAFGFLTAEVNTEGCTYVLHATEVVSAGLYRHHMDIVCPEGKSIKIVSGTCRLELKGQVGLTTVRTTNSSGSLTLEWDATGISYVVTQDGFGCPFSGTGTKNATYQGDLLLSHTGGGIVSVSGGSPPPPSIGTVASSYPATLTGLNSQGSETITTEAGAVRCNSHFISASFGAETNTLTLTPTFSDCTQAFGFSNGAINMEGCTFVLEATEKVETGVYRHHVDISCPAGKAIKIEGGTCKGEIKSQNDLTTVMTTNLAAGTLTMQPNLSNVVLTVTTDGFGCPFSGTGAKTATYHGDAVLARVGGGTAHVTGP